MESRLQFFGSSLNNRDNVITQIQLRREKNPRTLTDDFYFKNKPIHFLINNTTI